MQYFSRSNEARLSLFSLLLLLIQTVTSQVLPYGLSLTMDGQIEFSLAEPNYNGNIDDTVIVKCPDGTYNTDLRNVIYDFLTIVEVPDEEWTLPSNDDPSRSYDTSIVGLNTNFFDPTLYNFETSLAYFITDTIVHIENDHNLRKEFEDVTEGLGLDGSKVVMLKKKLGNFVTQYRDKDLPSEVRYDLYLELSCPDSVIEKQPIYDYLVDRLIFYDYHENQMTSALGYHWNSGVEFDSLRYDESGKIIYFSREKIGASRFEYSFEYNEDQKVSAVLHQYSTSGPSEDGTFIQSHQETIMFGYSDKGIVNSKAMFQPDGSKLICYFSEK